MLNFEKILVPIDFSDSSLIAVKHAAALARHFHAKVTLLHVNEVQVVHPLEGPLGFGITSGEAQQAEHLSRQQKQLEEFGVDELSGVEVKRLLCSGDPARIIVQHSRDQKSDLIFMPTHGHGSFRRFLLGSVTAKVLHDSDCPVWTGVHLSEAPSLIPPDVRHVMCAVNFGPETTSVIRWAASFSSSLGAKLTLVHAVLETPPCLPDRYTFQWHSEARSGASDRLHSLIAASRLQAQVLVTGDGDIPKSLAAAAQEAHAELLVIGRNCVGTTSRRLGSHTYSIICNAPCPVVSI